MVRPTLSCTTVLTAAKAAFDTQIDFMRRGLMAETAVSLYAEFIANLAAKSWGTGPVGSPFGDVCIPDPYLAQLQDENGTLLAAAAIDNEIADTGAIVSLMSKAQLANLTYPTDTADSHWLLTSEYLMEDIPLVVNISRLVFPDEGIIRVDRYKADACIQFEQRYSTTGLSTISADNWTANVLSLVLNLIDMGANTTKALQLLKHATAYTSMGMRCYGVQKSELQVPMVFLTHYARQSAWLAQNSVAVLDKDATATRLLFGKREMIHMLTSFSSSGRLPKTIITANGHLQNLTFDWVSFVDADATFKIASDALPEKEVYYKRVESSINAAISATIAKENDLAFSISRRLTMQKPFWPVSGMGSSLGQVKDYLRSVSRATRRLLGIPAHEARDSFVDLPVSIRQTCSTGWEFFSRPGVPNWTEQCCASICTSIAESLPPSIANLFTEACCDACNEYDCTGGAQAAAEGAADIVGIELLEEGGYVNQSIPIMI